MVRSPVCTKASTGMPGISLTAPSRVIYELDFVPSEEEWKPISIHVNVKKPD